MEDRSIDQCFSLNGIVVEPARNNIRIGKKNQRITSREMEVLLVLAKNEHEVVSREDLLNHVWKDTVVNEETLTLIVSRLRKALNDDPRRPQLIETIPKKGYRLMMSPVPCVESRSHRSRMRLGNPTLWITVLFTLLLIFMSLFFTVKTEYEKVSQPPQQTTEP